MFHCVRRREGERERDRSCSPVAPSVVDDHVCSSSMWGGWVSMSIMC